MEEKDINIRTFNAAKLFAEKVLFPMMEQFQNYQRQSDFGSSDLKDAVNLSEEIRNIERYNGLKAMNDITLNLAFAIESTVRLKKNKEEINQLENTIAILDRIKNMFYDNKADFFKITYRGTFIAEVLDRQYFESVKRIIQTCYVNVEILMTRNKLLFTDQSDEYKSDEEIMEDIKKEYMEA